MAELAARHHAAVSTAQLRGAGLGRSSIAHRVRQRQLTRLFRGVYRVGPVEDEWTWEAGALLACGPTALLSHHSAAAVWGLRAHRPPTVDVTIRGGHRAGQRGLRVHHAPLGPADLAIRAGLPVTSPARTLLDLAAAIAPAQLDDAVNEAQVRRFVSPAALRSYLAGHARHRGAGALALALRHPPALTRSELERRMLALIRRIGLPEPQTNVLVRGHEVDVLWPAHRLVVEADGYETHSTRRQFEEDRRRDASLHAAGYRVLRFSWRQVADQPEVVAARLAAALALSDALGTPRA